MVDVISVYNDGQKYDGYKIGSEIDIFDRFSIMSKYDGQVGTIGIYEFLCNPKYKFLETIFKDKQVEEAFTNWCKNVIKTTFECECDGCGRAIWIPIYDLSYNFSFKYKIDWAVEMIRGGK